MTSTSIDVDVVGERLANILPSVRNSALRMVVQFGLSDVDADSIVQDILLVLVRNISKLESAESLMLYANVITRNQLLEYVRKRDRTTQVDADTLDRLTSEDRFSKPGETDILLKSLDEAIQSMPPDLRQVIILHYIRQNSVDQIASQIGVEVITVRKRLHKSRQVLASLLDNVRRDPRMKWKNQSE